MHNVDSREVWKKLEGYRGCYAVSNRGRVCSSGKLLSHPASKKGGYCNVRLVNLNGDTVNRLVHRLVAEAFIPNPLNLPVVNHLDKVRHHNWEDNLEWSTQQGNVEHSLGKEVTMLSPTGGVTTISCVNRFSRENELCASSVRRVLSGRYKQHKGWRGYAH